MHRHQEGYIWRKGCNWYGRWREDVIENGSVVRKQRCAKLAEVCDRFRCEADVRPLLEAKLRPINEGKTRPEGTLSVSQFVQDFYLPFVEENCKPSTSAGYKKLFDTYLEARLGKFVVRDFRTVDAANILADVYRQHGMGRTTLKHIKAFLSGVFTFAKNQGVFDGVNPVQDAMIPKKAPAPKATHATTPDEVLAILHALERAGAQKASAAVGLVFFAGLRPGEARGASWEDFDGKRLTVRRSVWHTHTTTPKTEGSAKPVPIIEPLRGILFALRETEGNPSGGPILRGPSGKPLNLDNLTRRVILPALRRCSICRNMETKHEGAEHAFHLDKAVPRWHGWYSLRRGVATSIAGLSKDTLAAKGLLRHASASTTERHYIKDVPENTLRAMKQLEALCNLSATDLDANPS